MNKEKNCYLHPKRIADKFCERCGKFLCLECQCNFQFRYTSRNPAGGGITIPKVLCLDCYKIELEHRKKGKLWYLIILISILIVTGTITAIWLNL